MTCAQQVVGSYIVQPTDQPDMPSFADFIPAFFEAAFHDRDQIALRLSSSGTRMANLPDSLGRSQAIEWLLRNQETLDLFYADGSGSPLGLGGVTLLEDEASARRTCLALPRSILCRIAFGPADAARSPVFATFDDALANVLTCPLRPSIAWRTDQAIEVAYLIRPPYGIEVRKTHGVVVDMQGRLPAVYHGEIQHSFWDMLGGDPAQKHAPYFRVPLSKNRAGANTPRVPLLWCDFERRYPYAELERLHPYGITDILDRAEAEADSDWVPGPSDSIDVPFDDLPEDLRVMIKREGPPGKRLFRAVARMLKDGYSDECIQKSVQHGGGFRWLAEGRESDLARRVDDFIDQIRRGKRVYAPHLAPPIELTAIPEPVSLSRCGPLPETLGAMLDRYEAAAGIKLASRVRDAARFYEHMFITEPSGVLESPCGAGKSVWALCHAALHASPADRYVYVTETVDALYDAAAVLEMLTSTPVGRVHGFNVERCTALSGKTYGWRQCNPANPRSVCRVCQARSDCAYFTKAEQLKQPILCLTHNGLIRMLEEDAPILQDATLLVDENLSPFSNLQVLFADLERLASFVGRDELRRFFPCTSFAHNGDLSRWKLQRAKSFARRHFVFCGRDETAALSDLCERLKQTLHSGLHARRTDGDSGEHERAADTLVQLLNFFRPAAHSDATYAYREGHDADGGYVLAKRSRFSFETGRRYRRLWMLDASATLAPDPYPENLPVFTCPDLPERSRLVKLHVVRCNPTKIRQDIALKLSTVPLRYAKTVVSHEEVLVALDKGSTVGAEVRQMLGNAWDAGHLESEKGRGPEMIELQRGRIKGINAAGDCTLALLTGMATFTGIDDCALHATLQYGRTFPDRPHVFTANGSPNWPGGKMQVPAMRTYYALRSLDEIYQAIWRTAVRNDRPVEAIVALPDEYWLAALYRTVMPGMQLVSAYRDREGAEAVEVAGRSVDFEWQFERDERMFGMRLIEMPAGQEITKRQLASELGYTGDRAWEKNKGVIMALLDPFFEEGSTKRMLRRKAVP